MFVLLSFRDEFGESLGLKGSDTKPISRRRPCNDRKERAKWREEQDVTNQQKHEDNLLEQWIQTAKIQEILETTRLEERWIFDVGVKNSYNCMLSCEIKSYQQLRREFNHYGRSFYVHCCNGSVQWTYQLRYPRNRTRPHSGESNTYLLAKISNSIELLQLGFSVFTRNLESWHV